MNLTKRITLLYRFFHWVLPLVQRCSHFLEKKETYWRLNTLMKVLNVDLSQELSKDQLKILQTAFTEHLVLVFRQVKFHWSYFSSSYFSDIQTKHL